MADLTLRLEKGSELTFREIDDNFLNLDSDNGQLRRDFDSNLEDYFGQRDSDFFVWLDARDSLAASIILNALERYDSDILSLNNSLDSEHAWNVSEHFELQTRMDSGLAVEIAARINGDSDLRASIDSNYAWNVVEHAQLQVNIDSVNTSLQTNVNILQGNIDSVNSSLHTNVNILQGNIDSVASEINQITTDIEIITSNQISSTDSLPEGSVNLYYTDARVQGIVDSSFNILQGNIDSVTTEIDQINVNLDTLNSNQISSTDSLPEGSTNLYYTDARVQGVVDSSYISGIVNNNYFEDNNINLNSPSLTLGAWKITTSGTNLVFQYNNVTKAKLTSSGEIVAVGDVTAFGTM